MVLAAEGAQVMASGAYEVFIMFFGLALTFNVAFVLLWGDSCSFEAVCALGQPSICKHGSTPISKEVRDDLLPQTSHIRADEDQSLPPAKLVLLASS